MKITIRQAQLGDEHQLAAVDTSRYGDISQQIAGDEIEMFRQRILNSHGWFWVAEVDGKIEGLLSVLPVATRLETFVSWDECTANGTLQGCYDPTSDVLYVSAMTTSERGSELDVTDLLLARALARAIKEGYKYAFFAARMPDYHLVAKTMSAETFYADTVLKDGKLVARDRQVRYYDRMGMKRVRLVPGGFPEDLDSAGYSVLYKMDIPCYGWPLPRFWGGLLGTIAKSPKLFAQLAKLA